MGRLNMRPREADKPKKEINPVWRGLGCLSFIVLTVGCYFAADWTIEAINARNRTQAFLPGGLRSGIPRQFVTLIDYEFPKPVTEIVGVKLAQPLRTWRIGFDVVTLAFTLFLAILGFSIISLVWAILNPPKLGPKDAPPVRRKIDRTKVR
jgi:hypothetical protein